MGITEIIRKLRELQGIWRIDLRDGTEFSNGEMLGYENAAEDIDDLVKEIENASSKVPG